MSDHYCHDRRPCYPRFSDEEMAARCSALAAAMREHEVDNALVCGANRSGRPCRG